MGGGARPGAVRRGDGRRRFAAQVLGRRTSDAWLVGAGGAVLGAGLVLLALSPSPALVLVGVAVAGAGVSVIAPTLLSAVGARSAHGRQGADLAVVSALGYAGFVLGPPLVGVLSGATTLPTALALLALIALAVAVSGPLALRRGAPSRSPTAEAAGARLAD